MISAIELYNKPDFKYREESFVVLVVNAWELLLKSKILTDNNNKIKSIHVYKDGKVKRTRSGNPMTIDLVSAMRALCLNAAVVENLHSLVEIRDVAVHYCHTKELKYTIFTLGVATLKNYQKLARDWFNKSLTDYNMYIMPLAFIHDFSTLSSIDLGKSPPVIANIIRGIIAAKRNTSACNGFDFACEIRVDLVSAKNFTGAGDITVKIDQESKDAPIAITTTRSKLDRYPLTYTQLMSKVKASLPDIKQGVIHKILKTFNMRNDQRFSSYSFKNKLQEEEYLKTKEIPKGIAIIYNDAAVSFVVTHLR